MEKVELTSRLSAFDSFLFLVPDGSEQNEDDKRIAIEEKQTGTGKSVIDSSPAEQQIEVAKLNTAQNRDTSTPFHESNDRCIPGSVEESNAWVRKLSAFDKYMFLLNDNVKDKAAKIGEGSGASKRLTKPPTPTK